MLINKAFKPISPGRIMISCSTFGCTYTMHLDALVLFYL